LKSMVKELEGATDRIMAARYVKGLAAECFLHWHFGGMPNHDINTTHV